MKYVLSFCSLLLSVTEWVNAQEFVTRGKIEFEIKVNNKHNYTAEEKAENSFIASLPEYTISYRDLIFSWNQSVYQLGKKGTVAINAQNEGVVYTDLDKQETIQKSRQIDEYYVFADSSKKVKWKIENQTRKIAGWDCRKAVGRIYDSVYVVAFYCPEIIPQGGPEMFNGLPGMILGLAIPRHYTTWFATKVEIANIDESKITPPVSKKKQLTKRELAELVLKKYKSAGWWKDETLADMMENISGYISN